MFSPRSITAVALLLPFLGGQVSYASEVDLNGVTVSAEISKDVPKILYIQGPLFALWKDGRPIGPLEFRPESNYLSYIDEWKLQIFRSGDLEYRKPLKTFSGTTPTLPSLKIWDGKFDDGAKIRPGEELSYVLTVTDIKGRIDRSEPRKFRVARHIMPKTQQSLLRQQQKTAGEAQKPEVQQIPVSGLAVSFVAPKLGRLMLSLCGEKQIIIPTQKQILPVGEYAFPVAIGDASGSTSSHLLFEMPWLQARGGMEHPKLWCSGIDLSAKRAEPVLSSQSAFLPLGRKRILTLPHTDINPRTVAVLVTRRGEIIGKLMAQTHYQVNASQGMLRLTSEGAREIRGFSASASGSVKLLVKYQTLEVPIEEDVALGPGRKSEVVIQ